MTDAKELQALAAQGHALARAEHDDLSVAGELADAVTELLAEREWQPIETAPKDGRFVLLGLERNGSIFVGRRGTENGYYRKFASFPGGWTKPASHWQPLPSPPAQAREEGQ